MADQDNTPSDANKGTAPAMPAINVPLALPELEAAINFCDVAVRAQGLQAAGAALSLASKFTEAAKQLQAHISSGAMTPPAQPQGEKL